MTPESFALLYVAFSRPMVELIVGEALGDDKLFTPEQIDSMSTYPEETLHQINRR